MQPQTTQQTYQRSYGSLSHSPPTPGPRPTIEENNGRTHEVPLPVNAIYCTLPSAPAVQWLCSASKANTLAHRQAHSGRTVRPYAVCYPEFVQGGTEEWRAGE